MSETPLDHLAHLVEGLENFVAIGAFASANRDSIRSGLAEAEHHLSANNLEGAVLGLRRAIEAYPFAHGLLASDDRTRKLDPPRLPNAPVAPSAPPREEPILNRIIVLRRVLT